MTNLQLTPYIFFQGNCKEAMEFYQSVIGGELTLTTYAEASGMEVPDGWEDKVLHAELASGNARLFACDSKIANAEARKVELLLSGDDEASLTEMFQKLSDGGHVKQPLEKQAWGDMLGRLFDKYGLDWMVEITHK